VSPGIGERSRIARVNKRAPAERPRGIKEVRNLPPTVNPAGNIIRMELPIPIQFHPSYNMHDGILALGVAP
jgi:hypothetical protein